MFKHIHKDYRLMLVMLFLMKAGQFMLLPFLAIYIYRHFDASPSLIGLIVGSGPFIYGLASLFSGHIIDKFDTKATMNWAVFLSGFSLFFLFSFHSLAWLFLMNLVTGVTRSLFDIGSKSYGMSRVPLEERKSYFSLRFVVTNSAASLGPAVGAIFALHNSLIAFKLIGAFYLLLSLLGLLLLKNTNPDKSTLPARPNFLGMIKMISTDGCLGILFLIGFIFCAVFSQIDSTLPQYLAAAMKHGVAVYSVILLVNTIGCALIQIPMTQWTKGISDRWLSLYGLVFFCVGNILFALFLDIPVLVFASIAIVLAEVILMPMNDLLIAKIAPKNMIASYYGVLGVSTIGMGIGPMVGGVVYEYLGAKTLFIGCGVFCLLSIFLYQQLIKRIPQRNKS